MQGWGEGTLGQGGGGVGGHQHARHGCHIMQVGAHDHQRAGRRDWVDPAAQACLEVLPVALGAGDEVRIDWVGGDGAKRA